MRFLKRLFGILPLRFAYAHCDVPCGIYDAKSAQIASQTVLKMVQKIKELKKGETDDEKLNYKNSLTRMILTKEEHAQKCKEEILILWTDYFKEEHLEKFPELHDLFWKTAKLCSKNKQEVSLKSAQELVDSVNNIAQIFEKSKA
jgi:nickel superoxide dismutase